MPLTNEKVEAIRKAASPMTLEQQVCSLDLAKRLKKLGVKQESIFFWKMGAIYYWQKLDKDDLKVSYSAFTVAELGEMLPNPLEGEIPLLEHYWFGSMHVGGYWECGSTDKRFEASFESKNEADARAKMLIYLLENNLVTK